MNLTYTAMPSPVGELKLVAGAKGLAAVLWENDNPKRVQLGTAVRNDAHPLLMQTRQQLERYFEGALRRFDIPLEFHGTDFQKRVWQALLHIPFGETRSYAEIAEQIGQPKATRAVGAANGRNPISIIAPCHRVIGTSGMLTGFAGGLKAKAFLLALEAKGTALLGAEAA